MGVAVRCAHSPQSVPLGFTVSRKINGLQRYPNNPCCHLSRRILPDSLQDILTGFIAGIVFLELRRLVICTAEILE